MRPKPEQSISVSTGRGRTHKVSQNSRVDMKPVCSQEVSDAFIVLRPGVSSQPLLPLISPNTGHYKICATTGFYIETGTFPILTSITMI